MSKSNGPPRKILYEKPKKQNKPIMPYSRKARGAAGKKRTLEGT